MGSRRVIALVVFVAVLGAAVGFAGEARAGIGDSPTTPSFTLTTGGNGNDAAFDVAMTAANAWCVGQIRATGGDLDASIVWCPYVSANPYAAIVRTYAGPAGGNDAFYDVAARGSYAYAAGASRNAAGDLDLLLVRWTGAGDPTWAKRFAGAAGMDASATDVVVDGKGNAIVCGTTTTANGKDWVVLKYSPKGKRLWRWTYDGAGHSDDSPVEMIVDGAGSVYVTGYAAVNDVGIKTALTVRLSAAGKKAWAKAYAGVAKANAGANAIARCPRGGVYVGGWALEAGTQEDVFLLRYAPDGRRKVFESYTGSGGLTAQWLQDIAVAVNGSVVGVGSDNGSGDLDATYIRWADGPAGSTPTPGTIARTRLWSFAGRQIWTAVGADAFGGVYLTGDFAGPSGEASVITERLSLYSFGAEWTYAWYDGVHERTPAALACYGTTVAICGNVEQEGTGVNEFFHYWQY
jgi:hypothetical protein